MMIHRQVLRPRRGMGADVTPASVAAQQAESAAQMAAEASYVNDLEAAIRAAGYTPQTTKSHVPENNLGFSGDVYHIEIAEFPSGEPILIDSVPLQSALALANQIISNNRTYFATTGVSTPTPSVSPETTPKVLVSSGGTLPERGGPTSLKVAQQAAYQASQPVPPVSAAGQVIADATGIIGQYAPSGLSAVPTWMWLVGGGLALYLLMGRGK